MRHRRTRDERGEITPMALVLIPVLLLSAGLVIDGGRQLEARRDARGAAAAAARAGADLSNVEIVSGALDPGLASQRANDELAYQGVGGSVKITGNVVTVTATEAVEFLILPGGQTVTGNAAAQAFGGVTDGAPQ